MATRHAQPITSNIALPPAPLRAASPEEGKTQNVFRSSDESGTTGSDTCSRASMAIRPEIVMFSMSGSRAIPLHQEWTRDQRKAAFLSRRND